MKLNKKASMALMKGAAILVAVCAVSACNKVNMDNYAKLKRGMKYSKVKSILGDPTGCNEVITIKACQWGDAKSQIAVQFIGNSVVSYSAKNIK